MLIKVKELVGENAMTLADGEVIYSVIHDPLVGGITVDLDFDGVEIFASPFFNAGIARLLSDVQAESLNERLKFHHLSDFGAQVLRRSIDNAKDYFATSPDKRDALNQAVIKALVVN